MSDQPVNPDAPTTLRRVDLHTHSTGNGTRRSGGVQPSVQPASPASAPVFPATAPVEPSHERAYPQADGEP